MSQQYISFQQGDRLRKGSKLCLCMILAIIPLTQIVMGLAYRLDCPKQNYIPVFLLVNGGVSMLLLYILSWHSFIHKAYFGLVSLFFFGWFIAGNVWIYSIYEPNYNETTTSTDPYCNKTLYQFAFWTMNLYYIVLGLIICFVTFLAVTIEKNSSPTNV